MRRKTTQIVEAYAICHDCGWESTAANAQGSGSQHAERYGHLVDVTITRSFTYATTARWTQKPGE